LSGPQNSSRERFNHDFIDVTPSPVFAGLKGFHNGMFGLSEVLCGVPILGGVAAADVATGLTKAQVNPQIAHL
jgi:hypothetical protein